MTAPFFNKQSSCRALMNLSPMLRDLQEQRDLRNECSVVSSPRQPLFRTNYFSKIRKNKTMSIKRINADNASKAIGMYTQALEVTSTTRRLYISGQAPITSEGVVPTTFKEQAEAVWQNILAQLHAADMSAENLVKATTFLTDRKHRAENREVRHAMLQGHTFALTVVLADMFEDEWLLEIDAIAEK